MDLNDSLLILEVEVETEDIMKNLIIHLIIKFLMSKNKYLIYRTYLSRNGNKKPIYYKFCNLES